jgi:hypothetical protein
LRTVLIRVENAPDSGGYAVDLCIDDGTDPAWLDNPLQRVPLPRLPENPGDNPNEVLHSPGITRDALLKIGHYLHRVIHDGPIGTALAQACNGGQYVMFDVRPDELRCLPWETMALDQRMLFADPDNPYARATLPFAKPSGPVDVPVRLLVLVGDTAENLAHRQEIDSIQMGLRAAPVRWQVEILEEPSERIFFEAYDKLKPHVLHFIGHGTLTNDAPVLLVNHQGSAWKLSQFHIVNRLRAAPPRLVVLNACRTADIPSRTAVSGVAGAFEKLGSGAVVSMQGALTSPAAVQFSRAFYERLAPGGAVDVAAAAAKARLDVAMAPEVNVRDWALATLSLRVEPCNVLNAPLGVSDHSLRAFEKRAGFKARAFVNRTSERRELLNCFDPNESPLAGSDLHVVAGQSQVGKSTLVQCLLHTLHARGHRAVYVDLGGEHRRERQAINWVAALQHVNQTIKTWLPEAQGPCQRFTDDLAWLASGREPQGPSAGPLPSTVFAPGTERADEFLQRIFGSFREMLETVAATKPIVLALDRFECVTPIQYLTDNLLLPVASEAVHGVRLIVVDSKEKVAEVVREPLRSLANVCQLSLFESRDLERLIREFCALTERPYDGLWQRITQSISQGGTQWGPATFEVMEQLVAQVGGGQ